MSLQTNLAGRLRNTSLSKGHGLLPIFEAVVNSIHAIEERGRPGSIAVHINRETQAEFDFDAKTTVPIAGFTIVDNGCGFDSKNLKSFETLDSDHKIEKGCRGVGRLVWLKVFDLVDVESHFLDNSNTIRKITFKFNESKGIHDVDYAIATQEETGTTVKLIGFNNDFRERAPVKAESIAKHLLEHVLWYFVRDEGVPTIVIEDAGDRIDLDCLYEQHMHTGAHHEKITIRNQPFELTHIKFRASTNKKHQLSFCAANRLVKEESIQGKIPGLYGKISDQTGEFTYTCYVSSAYLDENVRSERTSFSIVENVDDLLGDISLKEIREEVLSRAKIFLKDFLSENISAGKNRVASFISNKAPRYRPIVRYVPEELLTVDPEKSDKEIELHLHAQWYEVERQLVCDGHDVMHPRDDERVEDYEKRLNDYLQKASDLKKSDLANYVSHRKVIIDLFQKSIEMLEDGKYAREDMIHELIMPMKKDSTEVFLNSCNLWLIDERLAFHSYLASDKTIRAMPITSSESTKEPDLLGFKVFDNPLLVSDKTSFPLASITVVEIKRPMRNDMKGGEDKDPIEQALGYVERIREGQEKTKSGLLMPKNNVVPAYCYVLCDLTPTMIKRCKNFSLTMTADGMGFFGYNPNYKAYIEVISFNQLVTAAKERNKAFFDALGLPST